MTKISQMINAGFFITISSGKKKHFIDIVCSNTPKVHEKAKVYISQINALAPLGEALEDIYKDMKANGDLE